MSREAVLGEVSSERIRKHVEHICSEIPHRAAGSANGKRMAEFSRDALIAAGVSRTEVHELPAIVSFPEHAEFRVEAPTQIAPFKPTRSVIALRRCRKASPGNWFTSAPEISPTTKAMTFAARSF